MPPLPIGSCETCSTPNTQLRRNPFTSTQQCYPCRSSSIIGITDIKSTYKLKEEHLVGLRMCTEPKPAFLGGRDYRWYLVEEVEERAEKTKEDREKEKRQREEERRIRKERERREKEAEKEAKRKEIAAEWEKWRLENGSRSGSGSVEKSTGEVTEQMKREREKAKEQKARELAAKKKLWDDEEVERRRKLEEEARRKVEQMLKERSTNTREDVVDVAGSKKRKPDGLESDEKPKVVESTKRRRGVV